MLPDSFGCSLAASLEAQLAEQDYTHDPVKWAADQAATHLWSKQAEIARAVLTHPRVTVQSCHAAGKSRLAATLIAWWIACHPAAETRVVTTAPTYQQVHAILWEELRELHRTAGLPGEIHRSDEWIDPDGRLVAFGIRPPEHMPSGFQGHHRKWTLVVADEGCGIPAWMFDAFDSITTSEHCRQLIIGNPDSNASTFAKRCADPNWHTIRISAFDTPNFTGEDVPDVVRDNLVSQAWVEDKRQRWGETNPLYVSKVLGQFADAEDSLIPLSWITAAQTRWQAWHDNGRPTQPGRRIVGVDVARYGDDQTALAIRQGDVITSLERYSKLDTVAVANHTEPHLHGIPGAVAVIDDIGVGGGVLDVLKRRGYAVRPFTASARATGRDSSGTYKFRNRRSQAWWRLREALDPATGSTLMLPPDDDLAAELSAPKWEVLAGATIAVEGKDDIRKRLGRSTDTADAVLHALGAETTPTLDPHGRLTTGRVHRHADAGRVIDNPDDWTPAGYRDPRIYQYSSSGPYSIPTTSGINWDL